MIEQTPNFNGCIMLFYCLAGFAVVVVVTAIIEKLKNDE